MSNTVAYDGNKIIFSGSLSNFSLPEQTSADFQINGASTVHTFIANKTGKSISTGDLLFDNTGVTIFLYFQNGEYTFNNLICSSINKKIILGVNAKVTFASIDADASSLEIFLSQNAILTVTSCIGTANIHVNANENLQLQNGASLNITGAIDTNFNIYVHGNNSNIYAASANISILSGATDTNILGNDNTIIVDSGAQETYIRGNNNNVTDNGVSTNITGTASSAPISGTFGNIKINTNEITTTNDNGNITIAPNGTGELIYTGANTNNNSVTTKNYVTNAISAITKETIGLGNVANTKNNSATVDPTINDDETQGYTIGSQWVNTNTDTVYYCTDASTGIALWREVTNINNVGDVNNGANVNASGIGVFVNKTLGVLNFKGIDAGSTKIGVSETSNTINIDANESQIDHNALNNYIANEHIDHADVSITPGVGISGGGTITQSRTISLDINGLSSASVDNSADFIPIYDVSISSIRKVLAGTVGIQSHNQLNNLLVDDHTIYALLAGRAGGQDLHGGVNSGDNLVISSTSHITKGSVIFTDNVPSTSISTGSVVIVGGLGVSESIKTTTAHIGNLSFDGNTISAITGEILLAADPISDLGIATKRYVDGVASGLHFKNACVVKAASLPSYTFSAGTITATANGALATIDGYNISVNDRVLVDLEIPAVENGIYIVVSLGSPTTQWELTRSSDANVSAEVENGMFVFVTEGNLHGTNGYVLSTPDPIVLNTTPLEFSQFSAGQTYTASNAINANGVGVFKETIDNEFLFYSIYGSNTIDVSLNTPDIVISVNPEGIDHHLLSNLTANDDHTQYTYHAGRSGGQTIYGGTVSGNLSLFSNNANNGLIVLESDTILSGKKIYGNNAAAGRLLLRGNNIDLDGGITIENTTTASTTTGALIVNGGVSIADNLFVGQNLSFANSTITSIASLTIDAAGVTTFANTSTSTASNNGSVVFAGGIGCSGNSTFSGIIAMNNATASTSPTNGALVISGGIGCNGNSTFGGIVKITNATNGALIIDGGIGCAGNSTFSGIITLNNATASTSANNGALIVTGGIGCEGNSTFSGVFTISNTSIATSSTDASFIVAGGIGVAEAIIGNNLTIYGNNATNGILTLRGTKLNTSGTVAISTNTASTSTSTGACTIAGGLGVAAQIFTPSINVNSISAIASSITTASQWQFTNNTATTSTSTGAIVITGGLAVQESVRSAVRLVTPIIAGNGTTLSLRANETTLAGTIAIATNTASTSTSTGAVTIAGGVGIAGTLFSSSIVTPTMSGGTISGSSLSLRGTSGDTTGSVRIVSTTTSSNSSTGALIVAGGAGIAGNTFFGAAVSVTGITTITNTTNATNNTSASLVVSGGLAVALSAYIAGISIINTTIAGASLTLSSSTSSIVCNTGVTIVSGNNLITSGNLVINNSANVSIASNGTSLTITGGSTTTGMTIYGSSTTNGILTLQGNNVSAANGYVIVANSLVSTSTSTGAFVVSGGVGIGNNLFVANSIDAGNAKISTSANNVLLESKANNGNISIIPHGTGESLVKAAPVSNLGIATKGYVDGSTYLSLSGEATTTNGTVVTLSNAAVIDKVLTGFTSSSGDVASTDTILAAFQKLDGKLSGNGVAGRIPVYASSKVLTNDANLTFSSGTNESTLTINSTSGDGCTISGNKELILQQTGDTFGPTRLLIRNRNAENGIIIESINPSTPVTDLIIKNSAAQRNIRVESRSSFARAGVSSFHIGGTVPDNPTLAVGDAIINTNTTASLCVGGYLTTGVSKLHVTDNGTGTSAIRFTNNNTGVTATDGLEIGYNTAAFINNRELTDLTISTNNTTRLTISSTGNVTVASAPSTDQSVATKLYADTNPKKNSCRVRASALGGTSSGGPGPGRTVTANPAAAMPTIDGVTIAVNDRILYDTGTANAANGIYTVTQITSPWIIVRSTDADTSTKMQAGMSVYIQEGSVNGGRKYLLTTANPLTIDTTPLLFAQAASTISSIQHSALSGLLNDDHTIYALLNGRGTSQTINGGIGTGNNLILRANSANTTTGSVQIITSTAASNASTGALVVTGGAGIGEGIYIGKTGFGVISINGAVNNGINSTSTLAINSAAAMTLTSNSTFTISSAGNITFTPTNNTIISGNITINNSTNTISTTNANGNLILAPNGTGRVQVNGIPLANNDVATKQYTGFGGSCRVDAIYGNNSTASRNGGAFATISAALAAAVSGDTVLVYPGIYAESFTIPSGVTVCGISQRACVISVSNAVFGLTLVTMNDNTTIENFTLSIATTNNVSITGILFSGTSSTSAIVSNCTINVAKNNTGTSNAYGIYSNGSGTNNFLSYNLIQCTVSVNSTGTGINRAIYIDSPSTLHLSCSILVCSGTNAIAVETNDASAAVTLMNCTMSGSNADISQTNGVITLNSGILRNNNANELSFTDIASHYKLFYGDPGTISNGNTYFYMGTNNTNSSELIYTFTEPSIIYAMQINARVSNSGTITFTIRKNQIDTAMATILSPNTTSASITNTSISFAAGDVLSVQANRSGSSPTDMTVILLVRS
jgi:hypothetical protein